MIASHCIYKNNIKRDKTKWFYIKKILLKMKNPIIGMNQFVVLLMILSTVLVIHSEWIQKEALCLGTANYNSIR